MYPIRRSVADTGVHYEMTQRTLAGDGFSVSFTDREVTEWGGLALLKRIPPHSRFREQYKEFLPTDFAEYPKG